MNFQPFLDAPLHIQLHAISATESLLLGAWILFAPNKGRRLHKILGYVWVTNMAIAILTSWFIQGLQLIGPFSPIHALSALATVSLIRAILQARQGDIKAHKSTMRGLYFGGLVTASVLAFLPGRRFNSIFATQFGEVPVFAAVLALALFGTAFFLWRSKAPRRRQPA